jgi:Zn-dependent peptidase ImmA (M78 family)/transcriptional regulator with XRE-family HTH domain
MNDRSNSILAQRLIEARCARGISAKNLAERIGVSRQAESKYENGTAQPREDVLCRISEVLRFPISFFSKPVLEKNEISMRSPIFFRSRKTAQMAAKDMIRMKFRWMHEIFSFLDEVVIFPANRLPDFDLSFGSIDLMDIENVSLQVRKAFGLGIAPIPNLLHIMEKNGVVASSFDCEREKIDACSSIIENRGLFYVGGKKQSAARMRFSTAHELGHMILHKNVSTSDLDDTDFLNKLEEEANYFASCFLLPRESFLSEVTSTNIFSFSRLKARWNVSIAAMIMRCFQGEMIDKNQKEYLFRQLNARGWGVIEPLDEETEIEKPVLLRQATTFCIEKNRLTRSAFLDYFRINGSDLENIIGLNAGYFDIEPQNKILQFRTNR